MKLSELDPVFMRVLDGKRMCAVGPFEEADGVMFLCPYCFRENGGSKGTHVVLVWFEGGKAGPEWTPAARWKASGTCLEDLTISPSIHMPSCWHGYVRGGQIIFC